MNMTLLQMLLLMMMMISHAWFFHTGTQLPAYNILKGFVSSEEKMGFYVMDARSPITHTFCSLLSAGVSILACNPADVVRTRIYNQPFDASGTVTCFLSTVCAVYCLIRTCLPPSMEQLFTYVYSWCYIFHNFPQISGKGLTYKHGLDCLLKTVQSEGVLALYKGGGTHYARLGPHIVLVFVFLEQFKKWS